MSNVSRFLRAGLVAAALGAASVATGAWAQELALKRVMLSSGGVGYFEYEAEVEGDATLRLTVGLDQVDDVLKSLVVYDDKGGVGGLSLPGREPLAQAFKDLPFGPETLASPADLLNALRGAEVTVGGARNVSGRVVAVQEESVATAGGDKLTTRHRVTLFTDRGLQQFILEEAEGLQFADPALRQQVAQALAAVQSNRAKDARAIELSARGQGKRTVRVAYIVAAPLWKASYRLTLPADPAAPKAALQGWAVIENMSGQDWRNVELTLVSGKPIAFRQALYQAYYVDRPEVPVEVVGRIVPTIDRGGVGAQDREQPRGRQQGAPPSPAVPPPPMTRQVPRGAVEAAPDAAAPGKMAGAADVVDAQESLTQVVFKLPRPVNVANGRTLSAPIVDRDAPAARIALYQPEANQRNPLAALRLANDGETGLPPGVLTIYERGRAGEVAYVGDARLSALPPGENRLLAYALDQKVVVERDSAQTQRLTTGAIAGGVLRYGTLVRQTVTYRVRGPATEARQLLVEQPRLAGWKLVKPDLKGVEISEGRYRLPFALSGGPDTQVFEVVQEQVVEQQLVLLQAGRDQLGLFARASEFDAKTRDSLARLIALHGELDKAQARVVELDGKRNALVQDQTRVRENLARVPANSDLHRRYLATMDRQETEIEQIAKTREEAQKAVDAARAAVAQFIAGLG